MTILIIMFCIFLGLAIFFYIDSQKGIADQSVMASILSVICGVIAILLSLNILLLWIYHHLVFK